MIKDSFNAIGASARELSRNWRGLALLCALYLALLACVYVFFATGVATAWQLVLSAAAALLTLLFFLLQSAVANFAQPRTNVVARAFAARSVFIYVVGFFVFALMPYFVLFTRTQVSNGWAELLFFGLRLALAFVLTLWGWTITLGALARATPTPPEAVEAAVPTESATPTDTAMSEVEADDAAA